MYQVQLQSKGSEFTVKEVINKRKELRQKYKMEKDKMRKSGNAHQKKRVSKIDAPLLSVEDLDISQYCTAHPVLRMITRDWQQNRKKVMENSLKCH